MMPTFTVRSGDVTFEGCTFYTGEQAVGEIGANSSHQNAQRDKTQREIKTQREMKKLKKQNKQLFQMVYDLSQTMQELHEYYTQLKQSHEPQTPNDHTIDDILEIQELIDSKPAVVEARAEPIAVKEQELADGEAEADAAAEGEADAAADAEGEDAEGDVENDAEGEAEAEDVEGEESEDEEGTIEAVEAEAAFLAELVTENAVPVEADAGDALIEEEDEEVEEEEEEVEEEGAEEDNEEIEVEEEVVEEEEEGVEEMIINKKRYYVTDTKEGVIYSITADDEPGDEVGFLRGGVATFYKKPKK